MKRVLAALLLICLAACAPVAQRALVPTTPVAPQMRGDHFMSFDGATLGYSEWVPPNGESPWAVIVALHGMGDYAAAFDLSGPALAAQGVAVLAYDQRGHGRSPQRGIWAGRTLLTEDLRTAVRLTRARYPAATLAVLGESMGAAVTMATFGEPDAPAVDRLILCAPAVWGWSSLPRSYAASLWLTAHTMPGRAVSPPRFVTRRIVASDNTEALLAMGRDPLMVFETRFDAVYGLVSLMEAATQSSARLQAPTAFLYGNRDDIIPPRAALRAASRLPPGSRTAVYANGYHLLLRDHQRGVVITDIVAFLRDPTAPWPSGAPPITDAGVLQRNR